MGKSMAQRGYDRNHWQTRRKVARVVAQGSAVCSICGQSIAAGAPFDLDHTEDRSGYRGPAHPSCNRSDGARRGNRMRGRARRVMSEAW